MSCRTFSEGMTSLLLLQLQEDIMPISLINKGLLLKDASVLLHDITHVHKSKA
jgi:hypothetical protein